MRHLNTAATISSYEHFQPELYGQNYMSVEANAM